MRWNGLRNRLKQEAILSVFRFDLASLPRCSLIRFFVGKTQVGAYGDFVYQTDWSIGQVLDALETFRGRRQYACHFN